MIGIEHSFLFSKRRSCVRPAKHFFTAYVCRILCSGFLSGRFLIRPWICWRCIKVASDVSHHLRYSTANVAFSFSTFRSVELSSHVRFYSQYNHFHIIDKLLNHFPRFFIHGIRPFCLDGISYQRSQFCPFIRLLGRLSQWLLTVLPDSLLLQFAKATAVRSGRPWIDPIA